MADELSSGDQVRVDVPVVGSDSPMPSSEEDAVIKMEISSDILIEEESSNPSRSSSPDIEVLEVRKSTTRFMVDLTADDDDDDDESQDVMDSSVVVCQTKRRSENKIAPYKRHQASGSAPLLDITSDDTIYPTPVRTQFEPEHPSSFGRSPLVSNGRTDDLYPTSLFQPQSTGELSFDGNQKRPAQANVSIKQECETLLMMQQLESMITGQPLKALLSSASNAGEDGGNLLTKTFGDCSRLDLGGLYPNSESVTKNFVDRVDLGATSMYPNPESMLMGTGNSSGSALLQSRLSPGSSNSTGYSNRVGKSVVGSSSSANSFCDIPLDMSSRSATVSKDVPVDMSSSRSASSVWKESFVRNLNTPPPPISVPVVESTSHSENSNALLCNKSLETGQASTSLSLEGGNFDVVDFALEKAGLSSDFKTQIPTHPNSAFQAVTPSTSSSMLSDPLNLMSNPQHTVASNVGLDTWTGPVYSSTSTISDGNLLHSTSNFWNTQSVPRSNQCFENALNSLLGSLATLPGVLPLSSSSQGIGFTSSNAEAAYSAGPSTSSCNFNQGGKSNFIGFSSDQSGLSPTQHITNNIPTVLPVLSPNTVIEHTSNFVVPGLQSASSASTSYKPASTDEDKASGNKMVAESPAVHPVDPPSPEEPMFSCTICLDSVKTIQSSKRNLCSTVCGHVFCSACLEAALKRKKECPMCRKRLGKKQYHPLFL